MRRACLELQRETRPGGDGGGDSGAGDAGPDAPAASQLSGHTSRWNSPSWDAASPPPGGTDAQSLFTLQ